MARFIKFSMNDGYEEILIRADAVLSVTAYTAKAQPKQDRSKIVHRTRSGFLNTTSEVTVDHSIDDVARMLNESVKAQ